MGGDPIRGLVQAGAASGGSPTYTGRDNAYMLTLDDGIPPWSGMFLWEPIDDAFEGPYRDGSFDMSVIQHEYTHGLSTRYVAGGSALGSQQAGSMGEGWSDWYALNHGFKTGLLTKPIVGDYVTGNADPRHPQLELRPEPDHVRRHRLRPDRSRGARRRRDLDRDPVGPAQGAGGALRRGPGR